MLRTVRHGGRDFEVVLEPDDGGYHAYCPELPGCHTQGDTIEEAMKHIAEAVELYCEELRTIG
jgi:predicted RNase H-like HicB family nuclease